MTHINTGNIESDRVECKRELSDKFERAVVAFLNSKEGGLIYIGVEDNGEVIGINNADAVQLAVVDRIKNNILPTTLGLFDVVTEIFSSEQVLKIVVSSGGEKPYYLRDFGMSPKGCYVRVGASSQPMTTQLIDRMYARRNKLTLVNMPSPNQHLSFHQLRYYYESNGLTLGDQFARTLNLVDEDGRYNYAAYLLADENGVSIKVAKYAGTDKTDLVENEEYGYCCLLKATDRILEKLLVENKTFAKIESIKRIEKKMIDPTALRETVINAIIHNDYSSEVPPVVELYSNRLTVSSHGGLPDDLSEDEFFECISRPRNRVLMRVFKDAGMVEQLGSGMGKILKAYDRSIFRISDNFMIVTFPYENGFSGSSDSEKDTNDTNPDTNERNALDKDQNILENVSDNVIENVIENKRDVRHKKVLELLAIDRTMTVSKLAAMFKMSERTILRDLESLRTNGRISRIGSDTSGFWQVND
ncbi:MAG: putative DNA binding domain-containing protein [Oscillospiraceae bacterium]|nr:putative DNA binding domain-containing protein [Oscillospiraceae bacterium]